MAGCVGCPTLAVAAWGTKSVPPATITVFTPPSVMQADNPMAVPTPPGAPSDAHAAAPQSAGTQPAPSESPVAPGRRAFLATGAGAALAAAGAAGYFLHQPGNDRRLVFATLHDAMGEAERLNAASVHALEPTTAWTWAQTLVHCAQSIEYSLHGFPSPKSALFQNTLGAAAFKVFALRGRMSHNLAEPIPGAPALDAQTTDASAAMARLRQAVQDFALHTGALQPHFAYGALTRAQYEQAHAMHLANHLSAFDGRG